MPSRDKEVRGGLHAHSIEAIRVKITDNCGAERRDSVPEWCVVMCSFGCKFGGSGAL